MNKINFGVVSLGINTRFIEPQITDRGWQHWLFVCFNTDFEYFDGTKIEKGKKNQCMIFPPDTPILHQMDKEKTECHEISWGWFYGTGMREVIEELDLPILKPIDVGSENFLTPYLLKILKERKSPSFCSGQYISSVFYEMIVTMARQYKLNLTKGIKKYSTIEAAKNKIMTNYMDKLALDSLAKDSGYSVSRFCELYKSLYNISPISDLLNTRIDNAKGMLTDTDISVGEIAEKCGFESIHYFSSKFKEATGMSPLNYRKTFKVPTALM